MVVEQNRDSAILTPAGNYPGMIVEMIFPPTETDIYQEAIGL